MSERLLLPFLVLWPMAGAVIVYMLGRRGRRARDIFACLATGAELAVLAAAFVYFGGQTEQSFVWESVCGLGISLRLDGFRLIFGAIAAFIWTTTSLSSIEYFRGAGNLNRYYFFSLFTFGAAMGVFLASDLFSAFVFFEIMGLTSYVMVIHEETPSALRAGETYITITVIGGMVMLMGLFLLYFHIGMPPIGELASRFAAAADKRPLYLAGALILAGYGVKAGMFPLHIWLPGTYSEAPAPAVAILSGILSKAGVFGILALSSNMFFQDRGWGLALLALSAATMVTASVLAVLSVDLKRTLAYSSMSQIGFILMGSAMQCFPGEHNALAARGVVLHMVNHSLIKLVLFTAAGVVFMNLKDTSLNRVGGFFRGKPLLAFSFLMGALGIAGVPLWNGYVSKTLLHESIAEYIAVLFGSPMERHIFQAAEAVFIFCGGMTVAYMLKLFAALFLGEKGSVPGAGRNGGKYMSGLTAFALTAPALILPALGVFPYRLMDSLADMGQGFLNGENPAHAVHYFSWANLRATLLSLLIGTAVYLLVVRVWLMKTDENGRRVYIDRWPPRLNLEQLFYRPLLRAVIWTGALLSRMADRGTDVRAVIWAGALVSRAADAAANMNVILWIGAFLGRLADRVIHVRVIIWLGAFICRLADAMPNMLHRLTRKAMQPEPQREYIEHGQKLPRKKRKRAALVWHYLPPSLLLFSVGFCVILIYLITVAWK